MPGLSKRMRSERLPISGNPIKKVSHQDNLVAFFSSSPAASQDSVTTASREEALIRGTSPAWSFDLGVNDGISGSQTYRPQR